MGDDLFVRQFALLDVAANDVNPVEVRLGIDLSLIAGILESPCSNRSTIMAV